ncbi:MAG: hypothetical protein U0234_02155 [Sandaracinus sp.]
MWARRGALRSTFAIASALAWLAAAGVRSQDAPSTPTDTCGGVTDRYWVDPLLDAIADRAELACACRERPGPARIALTVSVTPPGIVHDVSPTSSSETSADEASCVAHRVHGVAHAWLASMATRLAPLPAPTAPSATATPRTYDAAALVCPSPPHVRARSTLSRAYERAHPEGLRRGAAVPPPACRRPLAAELHVAFAW